MKEQEIFLAVKELIIETGDWIKSQRITFSQDLVEEKGLNNLVSYVDKEAETRLVAGLQKILPGSRFLTEEGTIAHEKDGEWEWIIDPLDGTTNFVHGIPFYCVSVALVHQGAFTMGIVYEPNMKEFFHAIKGKGAFLNDKKINVSNALSLAHAVVATGFPHRSFERMEEYVHSLDYFFRNTRSLRRIGAAALDLAYIACGRMDGFYELKLMPWDIAAGTLIVREAGGVATDFNGSPNLLYQNQILAGTPLVHAEMKSILDKFFPL
ncbi:MAG: inositol monophosphatase family protein [Saprospiraceae bacterium]